MKFDAIDLSKNGNISFSLRRWARNKQPFLSIVHVAFSGDYRSGSSGAPDAHYIDGIVRTVDAVWSPSAMILDLRDLDYAQALTKMNQQLVGLQAAQLSYSKISNLSLFNYLR